MSRSILFVHGIAQHGKSEATLTDEWMNALKQGAKTAGLLPTFPKLQVIQPFYGDALFAYTQGSTRVSEDDVVRSSATNFRREYLRELETWSLTPQLGLDKGRADVAMSGNLIAASPATIDAREDKERSIYNNDLIIALARIAEGKYKRLACSVVDYILQEVGAYLTTPNAMNEVDAIVADKISKLDTELVVVGHSLGAVVAFRVLCRLSQIKIAHFITVGGPLGINTVIDRIGMPSPILWPKNIARWSNFLDKRDIVSLGKPVDRNSLLCAAYGEEGERGIRRFDVHNFVDVANDTENHHGIGGYFRDPLVARTILEAI